MREQFDERRRELFILLSLIIVLILTVYFVFVFPRYKKIDTQSTSIKTLEADINLLEEKVFNLKAENEHESTFNLRKKMPEQDEMEKFLIDLEEIEGLSRSRVTHVDFAYSQGEDVLVTSENEMINKEEPEKDSDDEIDDEEVDNNEEQISEDDIEEIERVESDDNEETSNLETIQITLEVDSPNYLSFMHFLMELEALERIMIVSELDFTQPVEQDWTISEEFDGTVNHRIELQTFTYKE